MLERNTEKVPFYVSIIKCVKQRKDLRYSVFKLAQYFIAHLLDSTLCYLAYVQAHLCLRVKITKIVMIRIHQVIAINSRNLKTKLCLKLNLKKVNFFAITNRIRSKAKIPSAGYQVRKRKPILRKVRFAHCKKYV